MEKTEVLSATGSNLIKPPPKSDTAQRALKTILFSPLDPLFLSTPPNKQSQSKPHSTPPCDLEVAESGEGVLTKLCSNGSSTSRFPSKDSEAFDVEDLHSSADDKGITQCFGNLPTVGSLIFLWLIYSFRIRQRCSRIVRDWAIAEIRVIQE